MINVTGHRERYVSSCVVVYVRQTSIRKCSVIVSGGTVLRTSEMDGWTDG